MIFISWHHKPPVQPPMIEHEHRTACAWKFTSHRPLSGRRRYTLVPVLRPGCSSCALVGLSRLARLPHLFGTVPQCPADSGVVCIYTISLSPPCVTCQSHAAIRSRCLPAAVHAAVLRSIRSVYGMSVHAPMQTKCSNKLPKVPALDKPIAGNPPLHATRPTAILYGKLNTLPE